MKRIIALSGLALSCTQSSGSSEITQLNANLPGDGANGKADVAYLISCTAPATPEFQNSSAAMSELSKLDVYVSQTVDYACSEFCGVGAVGGNMYVNRFGFNTGESQTVDGYGLMVDNFLWAVEIGTSGKCGSAAGRAGRVSAARSTITHSSISTRNVEPIDHDKTQRAMLAASVAFTASPSTKSVFAQGGGFSLSVGLGCNVVNVTAAELAAAGGSIEITGPSHATLVINVSGAEATMVQKNVVLSGGIEPEDILWNFGESTSLTLRELGLKGTVLAPLASVRFDNGHVEGGFYVSELRGGNGGALTCSPENSGGELEVARFRGAESCNTTVPVPSLSGKRVDSAIDALQRLDVYVSGDVDYSCTEFCGVAAVGGNMSVNRFGYNTAGEATYTGFGLSVGGALRAREIGTSGACGNAGAAAGMVASQSASIARSNVSRRREDPVNDVNTNAAMNAASSAYDSLTPTTTGSTANGSLQIAAHAGCNVADVAASSFWTEGGQISITGPSDATLIINVHGDRSWFYGKNVVLRGGIGPEDILWNLPEATDLYLQRIGLKGTLLAPKANVVFNNGHLEGGLYVASLRGGDSDAAECTSDSSGGEIQVARFAGAGVCRCD